MCYPMLCATSCSYRRLTLFGPSFTSCFSSLCQDLHSSGRNWDKSTTGEWRVRALRALDVSCSRSQFTYSHVNEPSYIPSTCPLGAALTSPATLQALLAAGIARPSVPHWRAVTALWIYTPTSSSGGLLAAPGLNSNNMAPIRNNTNGMDRGDNCSGVKSDRKVRDLS